MGMDLVELVLEFEDAFDTAISDEAAERMQTVGDTVEWLASDLQRRRVAAGAATPGGCQSAHNFYTLRRGLTVLFSIPRRAIRPDAVVGNLIPNPTDRRLWTQFAKAHKIPAPPFSLFKSKRFPAAKTTVKDLVRRMWPGEFLTPDGEVDRARVFETVRLIVAEQMGVDMAELTLDTRYIDDLNCD